MKRAVFLDRDGVINRVVSRDGHLRPPWSMDEFEFLPGVPETVSALRAAGFLVIVATNQPDVAAGVQRRENVEAMHDHIRRMLEVDDIEVCYHDDREDCSCRKPRPGMLESAATKWDLDLTQSFMVGDRWRDIGAGRAAGCRTILVAGMYPRHGEEPDAVAGSLREAGQQILAGVAKEAATQR